MPVGLRTKAVAYWVFGSWWVGLVGDIRRAGNAVVEGETPASDGSTGNRGLTLTGLGAELSRLAVIVALLSERADEVGIDRPDGAGTGDGQEEAEWYASLTRKLLPQVAGQPYLVAAVVGGTNIGKSAVFNHLAGERVAASSARASHTKHPTCLVPEGFADAARLAAIFPGFEIQHWREAGEAAGESDADRLYWKGSARLPTNLLLLDTPDIDSDAKINWRRADAIRHASDLLIAVLTMQKYNDAAVKQFFREAAREDKVVLVVFNLVELPYDEEFWPEWLATFERETGVHPQLVFVAPRDRAATEELRLPFTLRRGTLAGAGEVTAADVSTVGAAGGSADELRRAITERHFEAIKLQTLRGAIARLCDERDGAEAWIDRLTARSSQFAEAARQLSSEQLARDEHWPAAPAGELVRGVREWWAGERQGWTRTLHGVYGTVGETLLSPFRWGWERVAGPTAPPWDEYRSRERAHVVEIVGRVYDQLSRLARLGNDVLRPRLETILGGASRESLLMALEAEQQSVDFEMIVREIVAERMIALRQEQQALFAFLRNLDKAAAVARPALSVGLLVVGLGPVGGAVSSVVPDVLAQSLAVQATSEALATAGTVAVGEAGIEAGTGWGQYRLWFAELQAAFVRKRMQWLGGHLDQLLLGDLVRDLRRQGDLAKSAEVREARVILSGLRSAVAAR